MKKIIFVLMAVATSYAFVACSSDDDKGPNCEQLFQKFSDATAAYFADPTEENGAKLEAAADALERAGCADMEIE